MNNRYKFFAWIDKKTEYFLQDITQKWNYDHGNNELDPKYDIMTLNIYKTNIQIPLTEYTLKQQIQLIIIALLYTIVTPLNKIQKALQSLNKKLTVTKQ